VIKGIFWRASYWERDFTKIYWWWGRYWFLILTFRIHPCILYASSHY